MVLRQEDVQVTLPPAEPRIVSFYLPESPIDSPNKVDFVCVALDPDI